MVAVGVVAVPSVVVAVATGEVAGWLGGRVCGTDAAVGPEDDDAAKDAAGRWGPWLGVLAHAGAILAAGNRPHAGLRVLGTPRGMMVDLGAGGGLARGGGSWAVTTMGMLDPL